MKTKKERIFYYDVLRAFAIIAFIICHVDFFFGPLNTSPEIIAQMTFHDIGRIGVPIFLMISGALLLNRQYELGDFLKRRFTRIIYPCIFWFILITLANIYLKKTPLYIWKSFIGDPSIMWYFWTLIGIYLFIPIINTFIEKYGLKGCEYFLIIWFFTMILKTFNNYPALPFLDLSYFAGYLGYPILGYYLTNKKFNFSDKQMCVIGLIILLIALSVFVYIDYKKLGLIKLIYQNVPMIFMGSGLFLFVKYLDKLNAFTKVKGNFIGKAIISISICSYGMYFCHVIVIQFLAFVNPHSTLLFPAIFVLIIFLSWLFPYIFSKIPYIKRFSGV